MTNCWVIVDPPCVAPDAEDVLEDGAADALVVDAAVLVEALVLDRDHGLLHHRGDVGRVDQDPALVVGQGGDLLAVDVVDDRVLGALELGAALELRAGRRATAIMIPKIQETKASTERPRKTSAKRSFFSFGRRLGGRRRRGGAAAARAGRRRRGRCRRRSRGAPGRWARRPREARRARVTAPSGEAASRAV